MNNPLSSLDFVKAFEYLSPELFNGAITVIGSTICGFSLAIIIGTLIALGRISKFKNIGRILTAFLELIRGTPLLVQILYVYYVVPEIISLLGKFFNPDYHMNLSAFLAGTLALGINYGAYMSEVIRSSILNIDKGQTEAALVLGYTSRQALWSIVIPQSVRISLPTFGNYLIMMVKDTSLLAFITVQEIILRTQTYASQSFLTIESYTIAALTYFILCLPLAQLVRLMEGRLNRHV